MACERCGGTRFEIVSRDGHEFAQPCACRRPLAAGGDALLGSCRIPPRYEHCTLETFAPCSPSHMAALEQVMRYCSGYPFLGDREGLGLLFTGNNGVGKTHLAVAALRELVTQKGTRAQFWDFHELMREIRRAYDPETKATEYQLLAPVIEVDVLLLDDLGAWKITEWMGDTLFHVINSRYMARRPTFITTNFQDVSPEQAVAADSLTRKEFFVDRIGLRLRSRLMEMCLLVHLQGDDFRENSQQGNRAVVLGTSNLPPTLPRESPGLKRRPRFGG